MPVPHCPHCLLPVADGSTWPYPVTVSRCPHCRLMIGAARARAGDGDEGDPRSRGSAAGVLANAARRLDAEPIAPAEVFRALRVTASGVGSVIERLRMLDYQTACEQDARLPSLAAVLATFGTWKAARIAAARAADEDVDAAGLLGTGPRRRGAAPLAGDAAA